MISLPLPYSHFEVLEILTSESLDRGEGGWWALDFRYLFFYPFRRSLCLSLKETSS